MFKKYLVFSLVVVIGITFGNASFVNGAEVESIFIPNLENGTLTVNYQTESNKNMKVMVQKDKTRYFYTLNINNNNTFPLQLGNGDYTIALLENIDLNKYKQIQSKKITLNLKDVNSVYLNSIQNINWNNEMESIKKAKQLTVDAKTDFDKVKLIYNYVVNQISYDYEKINTVDSEYTPDIEKTYETSKGMCYDTASLFSAMLRSLGIPTKLVKGYKNDIETYHAWNRVYIKDAQQWITIDASYDSIKKEAGLDFSMEKDPSLYKVSKEY